MRAPMGSEKRRTRVLDRDTQGKRRATLDASRRQFAAVCAGNFARDGKPETRTPALRGTCAVSSSSRDGILVCYELASSCLPSTIVAASMTALLAAVFHERRNFSL